MFAGHPPYHLMIVWGHIVSDTGPGPHDDLLSEPGAAGITAGHSLGELLFSLRSQSGMTQEELADASGLSVSSISDLERDKISLPGRSRSNCSRWSHDCHSPARKLRGTCR